jgi:DNA polymerase III delta subunit
MKGQREEARKILERLRQDGDPVIRLLAEQTLKQGGL